MNVLVWHVHGSWTTSFVQGEHTYLLPVVPGRSALGRGRAQTWDWPANAVEVTPDELREADIDVLVVQDPEHEVLARRWTGRRLPTVWLEHNAPQGRIGELRHPAADRDDVLLVHVTHTNALFWDGGSTRSVVVEHGIPDPGYQYTGVLPRAAVVVNEPARRGRVVGADLVPILAASAPIDVYGIAAELWTSRCGHGAVTACGDLPQAALHPALAERRAYLHPYRWTSLGLALIEAMFLGMPVVALSTLEVPEVVPSTAGVVSNRLDRLATGLVRLMADPDAAVAAGREARAAACERFALRRFLADWDDVLDRAATTRRVA